MTRVVVETGTRWVFASALDWPGWSRRGRGEDAALETLQAYAARYRTIAERAGLDFSPKELEVVARSGAGTIVDFGAPGGPSPWDTRSWPAEEAALHVTLLRASWDAFDAGAAGAPLDNGAPLAAVAAWPGSYFVRRATWHVTDHLWEIEDRATA